MMVDDDEGDDDDVGLEVMKSNAVTDGAFSVYDDAFPIPNQYDDYDEFVVDRDYDCC